MDIREGPGRILKRESESPGCAKRRWGGVKSIIGSSWVLGAAFALLAIATPTSVMGQEVEIPGRVLDASTGAGIEGVALVIAGTDVTAVSRADGTFVLRGLPPGSWTLRAVRLGYGEHTYDFAFDGSLDVGLEVRMSQEAIALDEILVETDTPEQRTERARGSSRNVVERPQIEAALGISRHLGDLIRQTVPGIKLRQSNNTAGADICLEFRGAADISLMERAPCNHPMLLIDGVPVANPNYAYGTIGLNTIQRIRVISPGEAGARYGSGSLYGVLLVETRDPRPGADDLGIGGPGERFGGPATFDWSQEPRGHAGLRTAGVALLGNTVGLAAGLAIGRECFFVDEYETIQTTCGTVGNSGAVLAAVALPAIGSAIGARLGGGTDGSVGRLGPALLGASMALLPGYVYSISTVGRGSDVANAAGAVILLVGTPLAVTLADRLFRKPRRGSARFRE